MQPKLVRISNWLTFTLLGLACGWLLFTKAFAPGGRALLLGKKPGALPAGERSMTFEKKDRSKDHDFDPLSVATATATSPEAKDRIQSMAAKHQRLPGEALAAAGLTEADRPKAEAIIDEAWQAMERGLAERIRPIADPKAKEGTQSYFILGDKAAGDAVLVQMRRQLQDSFGKEAAAAMLAGMPLERYFAAFGQKDVKIQVPSPPNDSDLIYLLYTIPADGRALESTAVSPREFQRRFGKVIPLPESTGSR